MKNAICMKNNYYCTNKGKECNVPTKSRCQPTELQKSSPFSVNSK